MSAGEVGIDMSINIANHIIIDRVILAEWESCIIENC